MEDSLDGCLTLVAKVDEAPITALKLPRLSWPQRVSDPVSAMFSQPETNSRPILKVLDTHPSFDNAWIAAFTIG